MAQGKAAEPASPSPCTLSASADKSEVQLGEPFAVELKGVGPDGVTWTFPHEVMSEALELRSAATGPGSAPAGTFRYSAAAFALGDVLVPAIEAKCRLADGSEHAVRSVPLSLHMRSALPKDPEEQKLSDIRPPLALSVGRAFWFALGILGVMLVVAAFFAFRFLRPREAARAPSRELSPEAEARAALARLGQEDWISRGDYRDYYITLAQIAKRYLERRLTAPVLEMTSSETVAFLRRRSGLGDPAGLVRDLTAAADQVKFAKACGSPDEAARHLRATGELIDRMEASLRTANDATQGQAA